MPSSAASLSICGVSVLVRPRQPQNSEPRLSSRKITTLRRGRAGSPATRRRIDWPLPQTSCSLRPGGGASAGRLDPAAWSCRTRRNQGYASKRQRGRRGRVIGDFVQGAVRCSRARSLKIHGRDEQDGQRQCRRQMQQAGTWREGAAPTSAQRGGWPRNSQPRLRTQAKREDEAYVIRTPRC